MTISERQDDSNSWEFALPTGEHVYISIPERGSPNWNERMDELLAKIEHIYPYMGFRPGVILPSQDGSANPVGFRGLFSGSNVALDFFLKQRVPEKDGTGFSKVRYGLYDVVVHGYIRGGADYNDDMTIVSMQPLPGYEDTGSVMQLGQGVNFGFSFQVTDGVSMIKVSTTEDQLGNPPIAVDPSDADGYLWCMVLWWPPEEYAHIVVQDDVYEPEAP